MCVAPARKKIREMNGIEGSYLIDCLITCCPCTALCALCQVLGEKRVRACATERGAHLAYPRPRTTTVPEDHDHGDATRLHFKFD